MPQGCGIQCVKSHEAPLYSHRARDHVCCLRSVECVRADEARTCSGGGPRSHHWRPVLCMVPSGCYCAGSNTSRPNRVATCRPASRRWRSRVSFQEPSSSCRMVGTSQGIGTVRGTVSGRRTHNGSNHCCAHLTCRSTQTHKCVRSLRSHLAWCAGYLHVR
jgi:hypothetical protein